MLNLGVRYPGNFDNPDAANPLGKFKNRSAPGVDDGSYAERDWSNDHLAYQGAMLKAAGLTPNGSVDDADNSQVFQALQILLQNQLKLVFPVGAIKQHPVNPGLAEGSGGIGFGTWEQISGRSLIGAGVYTDGNNEQRTFLVGQTYGEFSHKLTIPEMPKHRHGIGGDFPDDAGSGGFAASFRDREFPNSMDYAGGDQPHNNLAPVYATNIWLRTV